MRISLKLFIYDGCVVLWYTTCANCITRQVSIDKLRNVTFNHYVRVKI